MPVLRSISMVIAGKSRSIERRSSTIHRGCSALSNKPARKPSESWRGFFPFTRWPERLHVRLLCWLRLATKFRTARSSIYAASSRLNRVGEARVGRARRPRPPPPSGTRSMRSAQGHPSNVSCATSAGRRRNVNGGVVEHPPIGGPGDGPRAGLPVADPRGVEQCPGSSAISTDSLSLVLKASRLAVISQRRPQACSSRCLKLDQT